MKSLDKYTNTEKIAIFDKLHPSCIEEFNDSLDSEEHDKQYFWEEVMTKVLSIKSSDDWGMKIVV